MSEFTNENYTNDKIRALDAKFDAQKIAFAPLVFQAVRSLLELDVLRVISDAPVGKDGAEGLTLQELTEKTGLSNYGLRVLLEIALTVNIVKVQPEGGEDRFVLGKTGWFLLEDEMTRANFNFVNDVCYKGAFELTRSVKEGKPLGLEVFGHEGKTIYEVLSILPEPAKTSWFAYDHYYSDIQFKDALPIVFAGKPKKITDIGGNTAKWTICCCRYDPNVELTIVDLPGQIAVAEQEVKKAGFSDRVKTHTCNILNEETVIPPGADVVWMSQFLDCFSLEDIVRIMKKVGKASGPNTDVFILEPLWDMQKYQTASYILQATSIYFCCMANGKSKMYNSIEFKATIESSGFDVVEEWHHLGPNDYSLLRCRCR